MENLGKEIELIKERNKRVEADKAWETSRFRIFSLCLITYIITAIVFYFIGVKNYLLNAFIPTVGFYLSTQSLPFLKKFWVDKIYKK
ncbi:MAG: hypothetical protein A3D35_01535 [Candidatus Staskawiczbacteria bacterium RIFCSPHIGHO2_02_FULL_34_9]|uniref:2TM domain-containing protein n=1 Tax=Candidatus Staskawiczbacteria bacterium RIFCSPHIGHO2_02_FULL_34_9 TaxID=1802206 RepID=A0A1G2HX89_9BACT|nr:MAG: hypothetical protein A3D35_01535 [Candidatus Staskawiczbacteria bacterium RIFCSPHIGHO2_02_FULL_34_9]